MEEKKTKLRVNMHCEGCSKKISDTLMGSGGIIEVLPDLGNQKVTVLYDHEKTDISHIKKIIEDLGYTVG